MEYLVGRVVRLFWCGGFVGIDVALGFVLVWFCRVVIINMGFLVREVGKFKVRASAGLAFGEGFGV